MLDKSSSGFAQTGGIVKEIECMWQYVTNKVCPNSQYSTQKSWQKLLKYAYDGHFTMNDSEVT